jgi:hypothetical protein
MAIALRAAPGARRVVAEMEANMNTIGGRRRQAGRKSRLRCVTGGAAANRRDSYGALIDQRTALIAAGEPLTVVGRDCDALVWYRHDQRGRTAIRTLNRKRYATARQAHCIGRMTAWNCEIESGFQRIT